MDGVRLQLLGRKYEMKVTKENSGIYVNRTTQEIPQWKIGKSNNVRGRLGTLNAGRAGKEVYQNYVTLYANDLDAVDIELKKIIKKFHVEHEVYMIKDDEAVDAMISYLTNTKYVHNDQSESKKRKRVDELDLK